MSIEKQLSEAAAMMGRKGGKSGTGRVKARPRHLAQKAANARWAKYRKENER